VRAGRAGEGASKTQWKAIGSGFKRAEYTAVYAPQLRSKCLAPGASRAKRRVRTRNV
jgi:hypothetical protein